MNELTFPVNVVVTRTGLKAVTLRAWERRYGLPQPARSESGQRLYNQEDIETVQWLQARQEEGMSISHAVSLWHTLREMGEDPLAEEMPAETTSSSPSPPTEQERLRNAWLAACLAFDEETAERTLGQAFSFFPPETVCQEVLQKGLAELGRGWFAGIVSTQQEHFTSALAMRRLYLLLSAAPMPIRTERILVGCAPGDHHAFSPLLIALLLRRQGWDVVYLGANVPSAIESTIAQVAPRLVIMCAQQLQSAADLMEMSGRLASRQTALAFGGRIFNTYPILRQRITGHFLGQHLADAPQAVRRLLEGKGRGNAGISPTPADTKTLAHYRSRRGAIESTTWDTMNAGNQPTDHLPEINAKIAQIIIAALRLGILPLLDTSLSWFADLCVNYHLSPPYLRHYLAAYHRATQHNLPPSATAITTWLEHLADTGSAAVQTGNEPHVSPERPPTSAYPGLH